MPQRDELGEELGARRPGDRHGYALETTTSQPSGTTGSGAISIRDAVERAQVRRLDPVPAADLRAPRAREERVATRGPRRRCRRTRCAYRRATASAISSSAISSAASGPRHRPHRGAHRAEPRRRRRAARRRARGTRVELRLGDDDRAAAALEVARVQRLVVGGRVRVRDEDRGRARRRRAPRPCRRRGEIARSGAASAAPNSPVDGSEPVVGPRARGRAAARSRARREMCSTAGPARRRRSRRRSSLRLRAPWRARRRRAAPARPAAGRSGARASSCETPRCSAGDRPAGDAVLRPVAAGDAVREEDATRERRRQPVREPEVRVRLGQRGGNPLPPGRVDHRPGDVAAAAEDDVRPPPLRGSRAHARGARTGAQQRPKQRPPTGGAGSPRSRTCRARSPASGTSRASTRSGDPANVTLTPRSRSASAIASDGRTCPAVPPAAIRHRSSSDCDCALIGGDVKEDARRTRAGRRGSSRRRRRTAAGSRSAARPRARRRG